MKIDVKNSIEQLRNNKTKIIVDSVNDLEGCKFISSIDYISYPPQLTQKTILKYL